MAVFHGNLYQRLASGIGGAEDRRDREAEFSAAVNLTREQVLEVAREAFGEADRILPGLTPDRLGVAKLKLGGDYRILSIPRRVGRTGG